MSYSPSNRTVVLGLGTPTEDNGIAVTAIANLRAGWRFSPDVELVEARAWDATLARYIEAADNLMLVVPMARGGTTEQSVEADGHDLGRLFEMLTSIDQMDLTLALAIASWQQTLPGEIRLVGIPPQSASTAHGDTHANLAIQEFRIVRRLESWGHAAWRTAALGGRTDA